MRIGENNQRFWTSYATHICDAHPQGVKADSLIGVFGPFSTISLMIFRLIKCYFFITCKSYRIIKINI